MFEKRNLFDTSNVENADFQNYKHTGFITEEYKFERIIYVILFLIYNVVFITSLVLFYQIRNSAIVRERGFGLTFFGGIITFINAFLGFIPQMMAIACPFSMYNANILNVMVNVIFFCRSLRLVLLYYNDGFKAENVTDSKLSISLNKGSDSNNYLQNLHRKVNRIIYLIIGITTVISFVSSIVLHAKYYDKCRFDVIRDAMLDLKLNNGKELFYPVRIFSILYTILSIIMAVFLTFVKDANKYGAKFEMLSTSIILFISGGFNAVLQKYATGGEFEYNGDFHRKVFLNLFEITKGGKILFTFVAIYMLSVSITLPVVQYFKAKKNNEKINASYAEVSFYYYYYYYYINHFLLTFNLFIFY
jgi:hypothetical protein